MFFSAEKFNCDDCAKTFYVKYDLEMHMQRNHWKEIQPKLFCIVCQKMFHIKSDMVKHVNTVHGDKEQRQEGKYSGDQC